MERRGFFARLAGAFAGLLAWRKATPSLVEAGSPLIYAPGLRAKLHVRPEFPDGKVMVTGAKGSVVRTINPLTERELLSLCNYYRWWYRAYVTDIHVSARGAVDFASFTKRRD